jgi:formate C-acetyltransferase
MSFDFESDREYLEHKFVDPSFYDASPGLSLSELKSHLQKCFVRDRELPHALAKATGFREVLENVRIRVSNHDWFVGIAACPEKPLRAIYFRSWFDEGFSSIFSKDEQREINERIETCLVQIRIDYEHSVPDWDAILELGFSGLLKRAEDYERRHQTAKTLTADQRNYFEAVRIEYQAILDFMDRLCSEAEKIPGTPKGKKILSALRQLRNGAATDTYEALLQIWLYFQLSEYVDLIQTRSFGNLDRVLYPYFRRDLDSGRYTEKDIRDFFRSFMYQATAMHYKVGHPFYFGGTNPDGTSTINELSYLILDEYDKMGIYDPKLQIKVSENTPVDFVNKALNMIRNGHNSIVFVGEPCIRRTMLKLGYSEAEARTADIKGCYEYCVRGETIETAPITVNTAKAIGLVLHNGIEPISGKKLGIETGNPTDFSSFEQFYDAFMQQLFYLYDRSIVYSERLENNLDRFCPAPMLSGTFKSSLERAEDGYAKGARYNNSNLWICGPVTAANSLTMIKRWVYERKLLTLKDLITMLDSNWEGFEAWRIKLLHDLEKFGNNLDEPDMMAKRFTEAVAERYHGKANGRGGRYTVSLHSSNRFFQWAEKVEATPDGRRRGDELNKNMSASQGTAKNGATALVASVLKLDSSLFMADFSVDVMLHPSEISGDSGLSAMYALLMTYVKKFGHAMHFNVMDPQTLRQAQQEPEKFRDLQVRICGWNVLWNSIGKKEQDSYILQAEQKNL